MLRILFVLWMDRASVAPVLKWKCRQVGQEIVQFLEGPLLQDLFPISAIDPDHRHLDVVTQVVPAAAPVPLIFHVGANTAGVILALVPVSADLDHLTAVNDLEYSQIKYTRMKSIY